MTPIAAESRNRVNAVAVFGDATLALQQARPAASGATLTGTATFDDVVVVVLHGWLVEVGGASVLGDVRDQAAGQAPVEGAPRLTVRGLALPV